MMPVTLFEEENIIWEVRSNPQLEFMYVVQGVKESNGKSSTGQNIALKNKIKKFQKVNFV
jgi:hypothetical protein